VTVGDDVFRDASSSHSHRRQLGATTIGAVSGGAWFALVSFLDGGWALPLRSAWGLAGAIASAVVTGVAVMHLFQIPIRRARGLAGLALPLATLPTAIVLFSILIWSARRLTGAAFSPTLSPRAEFELILVIYVFYGLLSVPLTPVLFGLAYLNQHWARAMFLRRTA
jgi:hypothetical protein